MPDREWSDVTVDRPCEVCGKPDWCSRNGDAIICRRQSQHPERGEGISKSDSSGTPYWLWPSKGSTRRSQNLPAPKFTLADGGGKLADPDTLNRIYTRLLQHLSLRLTHKVEQLLSRGITHEQLPYFENVLLYRTFPPHGRPDVVRRLIEEGLEEFFPRVPGFFVNEEHGAPYWTIAGGAGLLIPIRDVRGRIVAIKIRVDRRPDEPTDSGKYHWLTSKNKNRGGPGPGAPIHVPLFEGDKCTVRITEGPLKADIATLVTGTLTIALPGIASGRRAPAILREFSARRVLITPDADWRTNRNVARATLSLIEHLS